MTKIQFTRTCKKGSVTTTCVVLSDLDCPIAPLLVLGPGIAKCRRGDTFNREVGERKALARALKTMPRDQRLPIWAQYEFRRVASRTKPKVVDGSHDDGPHEHHDDDRDGERRLPAPGEGPVPLEEML